MCLLDSCITSTNYVCQLATAYFLNASYAMTSYSVTRCRCYLIFLDKTRVGRARRAAYCKNLVLVLLRSLQGRSVVIQCMFLANNTQMSLVKAQPRRQPWRWLSAKSFNLARSGLAPVPSSERPHAEVAVGIPESAFHRDGTAAYPVGHLCRC